MQGAHLLHRTCTNTLARARLREHIFTSTSSGEHACARKLAREKYSYKYLLVKAAAGIPLNMAPSAGIGAVDVEKLRAFATLGLAGEAFIGDRLVDVLVFCYFFVLVVVRSCAIREGYA